MMEIRELKVLFSLLTNTYIFDINCLETLPVELQGGPADSSPAALREFLKRFSESKLALHRIKIMIVGIENIGKTTVTRALTRAWNEHIETENLQMSGTTQE